MTTLEVESMTLPTRLLESFEPKVFVETGSYDGRTIQQALSCGYDEVHSIELSPDYFNMCMDRFKDDDRVHLYFGDSVEILPFIIGVRLKQTAVFWLDAHIQEQTVGMYPAPVMHELVALRSSEFKNVIMVDDVRLMGQGWWRDIDKKRVIQMIQDIDPSYRITFEDSKAAAKDIMVAR